MEPRVFENFPISGTNNNWDGGLVTLTNCTILEDFGLLKKGDTYVQIIIDFEQGHIEAYRVVGKKPDVQLFSIKPENEGSVINN